ncbi:hypothetical protein MTR67_002717 [Solanum verrucosum]|uniref:F-box associated beta-propeller type 1 domain-containing protein n=1 Tax=Solanum verrucosum TaxID=315347 RepID=A0AAF0PRK7_SOLVR|nr:hypothetical protein MTR67_002717 [Solanum verrucosum]
MPVKSVGQFHCVSKKWCSFLSDPKFIKAHLNFHSNKHEQFKEKWKQIVGSCNGLVLVLNEEDVTFLINPTTLEYRRIPNSPLALPKQGTSTAYALGYDFASDDYKVITLSYYRDVLESDLYCTFVDVYSARMGFWRRLESISHYGAIHIHGALHWLAGKNYCSPSVIVAVDLTNEKFFEVPIPTITTNSLFCFYGFLALRGCLCALGNRRNENEIDVWMMKEMGLRSLLISFPSLNIT